MPRSAPGPVTSRPSSVTRPLVGRSRPATMRSSVDLPQPEGPRMVTKSLLPMVRSVGSSALRRRVAVARGEGSRDLLDLQRGHASLHGNSQALNALNMKSERRPISPITMMPKMIWPVLSSAWLSVIMWPMPEDEPISSATMT